MSIFQNKEWWSTRVGENEEFDPNHLCVANIDNAQNDDNIIIVGSYQGKIRLYKPQQREYKIIDLLYATNYN